MIRFNRSLAMAGIAGSVSLASVASAQQSSRSASTENRTSAIVASFSKSKHATKVRRGVIREKYKEVRSEPVIRSDVQSLSGTYEDKDWGMALHIRVDANGTVTGNGTEQVAEGVMRRFELTNASIDGALLTGTKVYAGGATRKLKGVFINRTSFDSPSDKGYSEFGLGVIGTPVVISGVTIEKVFYRMKQ